MDRLADSHAGQSSVRPLSDRAHVLLEINNAIVSHLDLAQVLNAISDCLRREIKHDFAGLALYDAESNHLRVHALDFPVDQKFYEKRHTIPAAGARAIRDFCDGFENPQVGGERKATSSGDE